MLFHHQYIVTRALFLQKAEEIHRRITKKFYAELPAWVKMGQFYFSTGHSEEARNVLTKALRMLKKKEGM